MFRLVLVVTVLAAGAAQSLQGVHPVMGNPQDVHQMVDISAQPHPAPGFPASVPEQVYNGHQTYAPAPAADYSKQPQYSYGGYATFSGQQGSPETLNSVEPSGHTRTQYTHQSQFRQPGYPGPSPAPAFPQLPPGLSLLPPSASHTAGPPTPPAGGPSAPPPRRGGLTVVKPRGNEQDRAAVAAARVEFQGAYDGYDRAKWLRLPSTPQPVRGRTQPFLAYSGQAGYAGQQGAPSQPAGALAAHGQTTSMFQSFTGHGAVGGQSGAGHGGVGFQSTAGPGTASFQSVSGPGAASFQFTGGPGAIHHQSVIDPAAAGFQSGARHGTASFQSAAGPGVGGGIPAAAGGGAALVPGWPSGSSAGASGSPAAAGPAAAAPLGQTAGYSGPPQFGHSTPTAGLPPPWHAGQSSPLGTSQAVTYQQHSRLVQMAQILMQKLLPQLPRPIGEAVKQVMKLVPADVWKAAELATDAKSAQALNEANTVLVDWAVKEFTAPADAPSPMVAALRKLVDSGQPTTSQVSQNSGNTGLPSASPTADPCIVACEAATDPTMPVSHTYTAQAVLAASAEQAMRAANAALAKLEFDPVTGTIVNVPVQAVNHVPQTIQEVAAAGQHAETNPGLSATAALPSYLEPAVVEPAASAGAWAAAAVHPPAPAGTGTAAGQAEPATPAVHAQSPPYQSAPPPQYHSTEVGTVPAAPAQSLSPVGPAPVAEYTVLETGVAPAAGPAQSFHISPPLQSIDPASNFGSSSSAYYSPTSHPWYSDPSAQSYQQYQYSSQPATQYTPSAGQSSQAGQFGSFQSQYSLQASPEVSQQSNTPYSVASHIPSPPYGPHSSRTGSAAAPQHGAQPQLVKLDFYV